MNKRQMSPDIHTFTSLLSACTRDREKGIARVVEIWRDMIASGIKPDLVCYNVLLQCLAMAGIPKEMKKTTDSQLVIPEIRLKELCSILKSETKKEDIKNMKNLKSPSFPVASKASVSLKLFSPTRDVLVLTLHVTESGRRCLDGQSMKNFLQSQRDSGLKPDIHTLCFLSQLSLEWAELLREVGVAERSGDYAGVLPDGGCLRSAACLQAQLGNVEGSEVHVDYRIAGKFGEGFNLVIW